MEQGFGFRWGPFTELRPVRPDGKVIKCMFKHGVPVLPAVSVDSIDANDGSPPEARSELTEDEFQDCISLIDGLEDEWYGDAGQHGVGEELGEERHGVGLIPIQRLAMLDCLG